jgi:23S rRNA pseudouridine2605 synthase
MTAPGPTRPTAGADQPRGSRPTAGADQPRRSRRSAGADQPQGSRRSAGADQSDQSGPSRRPAGADEPRGPRRPAGADQPGLLRPSGAAARSGPSRPGSSSGRRASSGRESQPGGSRAGSSGRPGRSGHAGRRDEHHAGRDEHHAGRDEDGGASLRLNKALSGAGLGSRRAVEELVRAGRVSVGGEVVHDLGRRVDPVSDRVEVDGSRVVLDERRRYWLLNKPAGVVSTAADPGGRPTVVEMVPEQPRVFPVGRLDRDTEGLLLLTNDGPLAYRLTHARYGIEKRYLAEVERLPADAPGRLRKGIELEDGFARPTRVRVVAASGRRRMVEIVLVEGRNREVRRLLEAVGAPVRRLVRTAVGPIRLTGLAPGEFRPLRPEEIRRLYKAAGL